MDHTVRAPAVDIGWLAGMLDGEGCIHLEKSRQHRVQVRICSTDMAVINKIRRVSEAAGIVWGFYPYKRHGGIGILSRHDLYLTRARSIYRLLTLLRPHLTAKAAACDAALARLTPLVSSGYSAPAEAELGGGSATIYASG